MTHIYGITVLSCIIAVATAIAFFYPESRKQIRVATWGGPTLARQVQNDFRPFEAETGIGIVATAWDGGAESLIEMFDSAAVAFDVVLLDAVMLERTCDTGVLLQQKPPGGSAESPARSPLSHPCGVVALTWSVALAWNPQLFPRGAESWSQLWDEAHVSGLVALRMSARHTLEIALLGDGVAPRDVYALLATATGLERAFGKLETLGDRVRWWRVGPTPRRWLEDGTVALAAVFADQRHDQAGPLAVSPGSRLTTFDYWAVPKGAEGVAEARRLIQFMTDSARMSLPAGSSDGHDRDTLQQPSFMIDAQFWAQHGRRLRAAFRAWRERTPTGAGDLGNAMDTGKRAER